MPVQTLPSSILVSTSTLELPEQKPNAQAEIQDIIGQTDSFNTKAAKVSVGSKPKLPGIEAFFFHSRPSVSNSKSFISNSGNILTDFTTNSIQKTVEEIEITDPNIMGSIHDFTLDLSQHTNLNRLELNDNSRRMDFVITGLPDSLKILSLHGLKYAQNLDLDNLPPNLEELRLSSPFPVVIRPNKNPLPASLRKISFTYVQFSEPPNFRLLGENLEELSMNQANLKGVSLDLAQMPPKLQRLSLVHNGIKEFKNPEQLPKSLQKTDLMEFGF